jgi:DNA-binding MarR family transcriptional regulator
MGTAFVAALTTRGWVQRAGEVLGVDVALDAKVALASLASAGKCDGQELAKRTGIESTRLIMALDSLTEYGFIETARGVGSGLASYLYLECTTAGRRAVRDV